MTVLPQAISVVFYRDKESAGDPRPVDTSWEGLVSLLVDGTETSPCTVADGPRKCVGAKCPYKSHSTLPPSADNFMCWSPVVLDGQRRLDKNVRAVTALVLDFDHIGAEARRLVEAALAPWDCALHTTHNHRGGDDHCLRVAVRLSRAVDANQWHRLLPAAIARLGVTVLDRDGIRQPDRVCKDRSRQYYLPSHPSDGPSEARRNPGQVLDVDEVLAWALAHLPPPLPATADGAAERPLPAEAKWDLEGDAVVGAIDAVARHFPARRRHELALALAGDLRRRGATVEDARYIVHESFRDGGSTDPEERAKTVDHTWALNEDAGMTGFATLCDILGADEAEEVGEFLTEARLEAELRGFRVAAPVPPLPSTASTAPGAPPPLPPPPLPPAPVDLAELRRTMMGLAMSRARAETRDERIDGILLRRCLDGRPLTRPDGELDVETVYDGAETSVTAKTAVAKIAGMLAFGLPEGTPWEAVAELLRSSLVHPQSGDWLERARRAHRRSTMERTVMERERAAAEELRRTAALATYQTPPPLPTPTLTLVSGGSSSLSPLPSRAALPLASNWRDRLKKGAAGVTASCLYNAQVILENDENLRGSLRWNEHDKVLEVAGGILSRYATHGAEDIVTSVQNYLEEIWSVSVPHRDLARRVMLVARECKYDPLADRMRSLAWDDTSRVDTFLQVYFGADDTPHLRRIGRRWLVGAVARALEPGCKFDNVIVFEGLQGTKKTASFEALGGAFYCSTAVDIRDKDAKMLAGCSWIIELAELDSIRRGETNSNKNFLTTRWDKYRAPFAADLKKSLRRCVFVGTTNESQYLSDPTGNRRYWPVRCGAVDLAALLRDATQIWAEAVAIYLAYRHCAACAMSTDTVYGQDPRCIDHRWWLDVAEEKVAAEEVGSREEDQPWMAWAQKILAWWRGSRSSRSAEYEFTAQMIALEVGELPVDRVSRSVTTEIGIALRRSGFVRVESRRTYRASVTLLREAPANRGLFSIPGGKNDGKAGGEGEK